MSVEFHNGVGFALAYKNPFGLTLFERSIGISLSLKNFTLPCKLARDVAVLFEKEPLLLMHATVILF
jgi:hypothetical protein